MRLWTIHPKYLDRQGLVALWREGLLAQAVLRGRTKGYKSHPQLNRFKAHPMPHEAIAYYLHEVQEEAKRRGYRFDAAKIDSEKNPQLQRIQAAWLQVNAQAVLTTEGAEFIEVAGRGRVQHAKHQRGGVVRHGDLDLGQARAYG